MGKYGLYHVQEMENVENTLETIDKEAQNGGCKDSSALCGEKFNGSFYRWRRLMVDIGVSPERGCITPLTSVF